MKCPHCKMPIVERWLDDDRQQIVGGGELLQAATQASRENLAEMCRLTQELAEAKAEMEMYKSVGHVCGHCGKICHCDEDQWVQGLTDCRCDPDINRLSDEINHLTEQLTSALQECEKLKSAIERHQKYASMPSSREFALEKQVELLEAELVSARDRIKQLESRLSIEVDGTVHHDGCLKEIERLTAEVEQAKQDAWDQSEFIQRHWISQYEAEGFKQEIYRLKSELAKYKLKRETGPVPKTAWYWTRQTDEADDTEYLAPEWLTTNINYLISWFGPIPEPEEEV